ncbi:acyl-CoA dehydrogenase family protein [Limnohabitans sp. Rim8]|uniref:acyl-CoA dehydrogenase family protein n=1 Tax=Limnohabitans sp. Rim8 TaxID=1100718 RepID=UPI00263193A3|nr:acyl-CoA dehydrogenase family protein [Limnohabitans sp. Rim8]
MISDAEGRPIPVDRVFKETDHFVQRHLVLKAAQWGRGLFERQALFEPAGDAGLLSLQVPRAFGGSDLSFGDKVKVLQKLARIDFSAAMALVNSHNVAVQLVKSSPYVLSPLYAGDLMRGRIVACTALTEPNAGSDLGQIQTTAIRHGDGWILNGSKTWIINAAHADGVVVYAQTQAGAGVKGIAAFFVRAESLGFERVAVSTNSALTSMGIGGIRLTNVYCDASHLLYEPGKAFVDIMGAINRARTYVAAMCCAMVSQALTDVRVYGQKRTAFGQSLDQFQGWRWQVAQAATALQAGELLVSAACDLIDQGSEAQTAAAQAKLYSTSMAQTQLGSLLHAMGAEGFLDQYAFLRHLTAAHAASLADGSTAMLLERVAQDFRFKPGAS